MLLSADFYLGPEVRLSMSAWMAVTLTLIRRIVPAAVASCIFNNVARATGSGSAVLFAVAGGSMFL